MITKEMMGDNSRALTIRQNLEDLQRSLTNGQFLDALTVAFITKEADMEILSRQMKEEA